MVFCLALCNRANAEANDLNVKEKMQQRAVT